MRVNYVNDRVTTFGTAFLGLTLECARCHDHKFDPISQKEFYQLFAFFDDIDEAGLYFAASRCRRRRPRCGCRIPCCVGVTTWRWPRCAKRTEM
jgi:hypothetical protein